MLLLLELLLELLMVLLLLLLLHVSLSICRYFALGGLGAWALLGRLANALGSPDWPFDWLRRLLL